MIGQSVARLPAGEWDAPAGGNPSCPTLFWLRWNSRQRGCASGSLAAHSSWHDGRLMARHCRPGLSHHSQGEQSSTTPGRCLGAGRGESLPSCRSPRCLRWQLPARLTLTCVAATLFAAAEQICAPINGLLRPRPPSSRPNRRHGSKWRAGWIRHDIQFHWHNCGYASLASRFPRCGYLGQTQGDPQGTQGRAGRFDHPPPPAHKSSPTTGTPSGLLSGHRRTQMGPPLFTREVFTLLWRNDGRPHRAGPSPRRAGRPLPAHSNFVGQTRSTAATGGATIDRPFSTSSYATIRPRRGHRTRPRPVEAGQAGKLAQYEPVQTHSLTSSPIRLPAPPCGRFSGPSGQGWRRTGFIWRPWPFRRG